MGWPRIVADEKRGVTQKTANLRKADPHHASPSNDCGHIVGPGSDEYGFKIERLAEVAGEFQEAGYGPGLLRCGSKRMNHRIWGRRRER